MPYEPTPYKGGCTTRKQRIDMLRRQLKTSKDELAWLKESSARRIAAWESIIEEHTQELAELEAEEGAHPQ